MDYFRQNRPVLILVAVVGLLVFCTAVGTLLIANLQSTKPPTPPNFKISLSRTVCFGFCPAYTVEVDDNGKAVFTGDAYTEVDDQTTEYQVSVEEVTKLRQEVERIGFFSLRDRYENVHITDLPSQKITVTLDGKTKSIYMYGLVGEDIPKELDGLAQMIDKVAQTDVYTKGAVDLPLPIEESVE